MQHLYRLPVLHHPLRRPFRAPRRAARGVVERLPARFVRVAWILCAVCFVNSAMLFGTALYVANLPGGVLYAQRAMRLGSRATMHRRTTTTEPVVRPVLLLNHLGSVTHAPEELLERAHTLASRGHAVLIRESTAARSLFDTGVDAWGVLLPQRRAPGLFVQQIGSGSILDLAGVQNGDVLLAINGFACPGGSESIGGTQGTAPAQAQAVVFEIERGGRPMVLAVRTPLR